MGRIAAFTPGVAVGIIQVKCVAQRLVHSEHTVKHVLVSAGVTPADSSWSEDLADCYLSLINKMFLALGNRFT